MKWSKIIQNVEYESKLQECNKMQTYLFILIDKNTTKHNSYIYCTMPNKKIK